jgi:hypothetical protein
MGLNIGIRMSLKRPVPHVTKSVSIGKLLFWSRRGKAKMSVRPWK